MSKITKDKIVGHVEKKTNKYKFSSWRDDSKIHVDVGCTYLRMSFKEFDELFEFVIDTRNKHYNYFQKLIAREANSSSVEKGEVIDDSEVDETDKISAKSKLVPGDGLILSELVKEDGIYSKKCGLDITEDIGENC